MDLDVLIPAHLAARLVGVSRQLINKWRGRTVNPLRPAGRDSDGRPLYRAGDVIAVDRETRRSPRSSRRMPTPTVVGERRDAPDNGVALQR